MVRKLSARLPAEPILAYPLRPLALQMTARHGGKPASHARLLARARAEGSITLASADKVAVALGTHPLCLWGKAWEHPEAPLAVDEDVKAPSLEVSTPHTCRYPGCNEKAETEDQLNRHAGEAHPRWCRTCHRSFDAERERVAHERRAHGRSEEHLPTTESPAPPTDDLELEAIGACCEVLAPLPAAGRLRVLDYLAQRFVVDADDGVGDPVGNHTAVTLLAAPGPSQGLVAADAVPFGKEGR